MNDDEMSGSTVLDFAGTEAKPETADDDEADRMIAMGQRFKHEADPDDPRWDIVTLRIPNAKMFDGDDAKPGGTGYCEVSGPLARWRTVRFVCATANGIGKMLSAPPIFHKLLSVLFNEARVQEALIGSGATETEPAKG